VNKFIVFILLFAMNAQAACDWSKGITPGPNNTFIYTQECHEAVGALVQSNKDLTAAIALKDLAIQNSDARVALWEHTADDEMARIQKLDSQTKHDEWFFFALGSLTVIGAGFMAAKLIGH
jgi:hypothetical protein